MISPFVSQKFRFWSFVSMVLLVFVHGYNLDLRYLQPWTFPGEPMTIDSFTEYFLANGLFRFRIPMLFVISGFLYALHDQVPNKTRIPKRLRTLLIPYLTWSAFGLLLTFVMELFPLTRQMVTGSHVVQIDNTRMMIHDYHWYEVLARWLFFPVSYQLWFIRVLLVYNAAYPLLRQWVTHKRNYIFFGIAGLLWLTTQGFVFLEGEGLLFFSLGIWIQKTGFSIESPGRRLNPLWWGLLFVAVAGIKTWLAFQGEIYLGPSLPFVLILCHKLVVLSGLITCWYGLDGVVAWAMSRKWFVWLSAFSFFIYALHAPLVAFLIDDALNLVRPAAGFHLITFFALPLALVTVIIGMAALLRKISPSIYGILTGGRGV